MKAKVLSYRYSDGSGSEPVRVYLESEYSEAESDLELLKVHASDCKTWELKEVSVIGIDNKDKE